MKKNLQELILAMSDELRILRQIAEHPNMDQIPLERFEEAARAKARTHKAAVAVGCKLE